MKQDKKHTHGFKAPANYFDEFEGTLTHRILESQMPSKSGFIIPEGYFEGMEDKVMGSILNEKTKRNSKVIPLWRRNTIWYTTAIAASLILGWMVFTPSETHQIDQLPLSEIDNYIQNAEIDIEIYDVAQLFTEADWEQLPEALEFEVADLETYLLEHLDETTFLME